MLTQLPVAYVGKADDPAAADAEDLLDHTLHVHHRLQRLRKDHEIKLPVGKGRKSAVQVGLHDVQPAADAGQIAFSSNSMPMMPVQPRRRSRASSPPLPQPRSSTLAPGGINSTIES